MPSEPRIRPGGIREIGPINWAIARVSGLALKGKPPNVMTTMARNRRLFRPWLRFNAKMMPRGKLPRRQTELLILRTAHNCGSDYEWHHHARMGRAAGLSPDELERVRQGPEAQGWNPREAAMLRAADELHADDRISDETWAALSSELSPPLLIELCLLVGHYSGLAGTLNSLGVQVER